MVQAKKINRNGQASLSDSGQLARIAELLEALVRLQLVTVCERELADPKMRELYNATGSKLLNDLTKSLRMSSATICAKWKRWEELGMIVKQGQSYRKVV